MQAASCGASPSKQSSVEQHPGLETVVKKDADAGEESDVDVRKVPEMSGRLSGSAGPAKLQGGSSSSRRRGAAPAEKENKRIKRLLRNRVSAQQARERKKAYLLELETRIKELEHKNAELEERVSTLQRENHMLRQIVRNTTMKKQ